MIFKSSSNDVFYDAVNATCNMYRGLNKMGLSDIDKNATNVLFKVMKLNSGRTSRCPAPEDFEVKIKLMLEKRPKLFYTLDGVLKCDTEDLRRKQEKNKAQSQMCSDIVDSVIKLMDSMFPGETCDSLVHGDFTQNQEKSVYANMVQLLKVEIIRFDNENLRIDQVLRFISGDS